MMFYPKRLIYLSLKASPLSMAGYVYDWTLTTKVAIDELQVGGLNIVCAEKRL